MTIITDEEGHDDSVLRSFLAELNAIHYGPLLNLKLQFRPELTSNNGMRRLCRPKGCNPLKYTFDLSGCQPPSGWGCAAQYNVFTTNPELFFNDNIATNYIDNKISKYNGKLLITFVTHCTVMRHKEEPWAKLLLRHMPTGS